MEGRSWLSCLREVRECHAREGREQGVLSREEVQDIQGGKRKQGIGTRSREQGGNRSGKKWLLHIPSYCNGQV
jgi:intein/homing endonuclease